MAIVEVVQGEDDFQSEGMIRESEDPKGIPQGRGTLLLRVEHSSIVLTHSDGVVIPEVGISSAAGMHHEQG